MSIITNIFKIERVQIPLRTKQQKRYIKKDSIWTAEEDECLTQCMKLHSEKSWKFIGKTVKRS